MTQPIRRMASASLERVETWPGVARQEAITAGAMWSGLARLEPGAATAWHHHGRHETSLYVVSGTIRLEFGRQGADALEVTPGDFIHVPAGTVHRELNAGRTPAITVMTRAGEGPAMHPVDGPEA
jgi:uncharacterized RmlC-like cupin family protein